MSQCEHTQHHTGGVKICFLCAAEAAAARTRMQQHLENLESIRLKQVREPIGFRLIAPRARRVCVQSTEPLRYQLDDLTRQRIAASLDIV